MSTRKLILLWHLGLGDAIICNGLVRELAKQYGTILLPGWSHNAPSLHAMFSDLEEQRKVIGFISDVHTRDHMLNLGQADFAEIKVLGPDSPGWNVDGETFDESFYRQAGVDFCQRWGSFHIPGLPKKLPEMERFAFIHDDPRRGYKINTSLVSLPAHFRPSNSGASITDHIPAIQSAAEIHCIDSSFIHLVDSIPTQGRLFYHKYARNSDAFNQTKKRKKWHVYESIQDNLSPSILS